MTDLSILSCRRPVALGLSALIALLLGLGLWAGLARIDGAIIAAGRIEVARNRQQVQHPDGGLVQSLLVAEGQSVVAGQVLLRLDGSQLAPALAAATAQLQSLRAGRARHRGGQGVAEPAESSPEFAAPAPVATAAATPAGAPIVSRLAGHARLARVVRTFGQTLPEKLHAMDEALAAGRFDELAALAHWLKGAGGTVGFDEFFEPARQFEQHARAGRLPELTAGLRELAARLVIPADEPVRRAATAAAAADDVTA